MVIGPFRATQLYNMGKTILYCTKTLALENPEEASGRFHLQGVPRMNSLWSIQSAQLKMFICYQLHVSVTVIS